MSLRTVIDLTNYKESTSARLPEGEYLVKIKSFEKKVSSSQNDMIRVELEVAAGDQKGSVIFDNLVQTERALFRTVQFLRALGKPVPTKRFTFDWSTLIGKVAQVEVQDNESNGRVYTNVSRYFKAEASSVMAARGSEDVQDLEDLEDDSVEPAEDVSAEPIDLDEIEEV